MKWKGSYHHSFSFSNVLSTIIRVYWGKWLCSWHCHCIKCFIPMILRKWILWTYPIQGTGNVSLWAVS